MGRRDSYEVSQMGDNTYATILPRNANSDMNGTLRTQRIRNSSFVSTIGNGDMADYATLRNVNRTPPSTVRQYIGFHMCFAYPFCFSEVFSFYFSELLGSTNFFLIFTNFHVNFKNILIFFHSLNCTNLLDQHSKR